MLTSLCTKYFFSLSFLLAIPYPTRTPVNTDFIPQDANINANVMKILTENLPLGHPQEVLGSKQSGPLSISAPNPSDTYATLTSVVADNYDKQDLNIIFDSLLQKWPESGSFPDPNPEVCLVSLATLGTML